MSFHLSGANGGHTFALTPPHPASQCQIKLKMMVREDFTATEKAPTGYCRQSSYTDSAVVFTLLPAVA